MPVKSVCRVHLVGAMPLASVEEVLTTSSDILGTRAKRLSDGELGLTKDWIVGHHRVFEQHQAFEGYEHLERFDPRVPNLKRRRFRLMSDGPVTAASFAPIGYAEDAKFAYHVLCGLKQAGRVPVDTRLLVAMPTPYDVLNFAIDESDYAKVAPAYEAHMLDEVDAIARTVPPKELAIQWDAAHEFEFLATSSRMFHVATREDLIDMLVRLGDHVPRDADLGYHCCYGNFNLKHFVEPRDMTDMVDVINAVTANMKRTVQFVHMPVPRYRADEGYFAPLNKLRLKPETELYLGLVHDVDGVEGALNRAASATKAIDNFGISTECGFALRTPENIRQILNIEAETAARLDRQRG